MSGSSTSPSPGDTGRQQAGDWGRTGTWFDLRSLVHGETAIHIIMRDSEDFMGRACWAGSELQR